MYHQQQQIMLGSSNNQQEHPPSQNPFVMPQSSMKPNPPHQTGQQYYGGMGMMGRGSVNPSQFMANPVPKNQDYGGFPQQQQQQQQQVQNLYSQVCQFFKIMYPIIYFHLFIPLWVLVLSRCFLTGGLLEKGEGVITDWGHIKILTSQT